MAPDEAKRSMPWWRASVAAEGPDAVDVVCVLDLQMQYLVPRWAR